MGNPRILCMAQGKTAFPSLNKAVFKSHERSRIEARHLLRALLRQCTYLPDIAARHYAHHFIIDRYRRYYPRSPQSVNFTIQRRSTIIKQAYRALALLERANKGYPSHLLKVLSMTYGRVGKRRHEMLQEFIQPGPSSGSIVAVPGIPKDGKALESLHISMDSRIHQPMTASLLVESGGVQAPHKSSTFIKPYDVVGPVLGERLEALAKSQKSETHPIFKKPCIKSTAPDIPLKNIWGRSTPLKRVRNLKEKRYAEILDKVQPPLPERDWNRLRDLIRGRIPWDGPVRRRAKIVSRSIPIPNISITPANGDGHVAPSLEFTQDNGQIPKVKERRLLASNPHKITRRFMRGLWIKIFVQCPRLQRDTERNEWSVSWGGSHQHKEIALDANACIDSSMFEGVDERGRIICP